MYKYLEENQKLFYRTKDVLSSPCEVDWAAMVENGCDWVKEKYPTVYEDYKAQSTCYIDPFTGDECEIEITPKTEMLKRKGGLGNV